MLIWIPVEEASRLYLASYCLSLRGSNFAALLCAHWSMGGHWAEEGLLDYSPVLVTFPAAGHSPCSVAASFSTQRQDKAV